MVQWSKSVPALRKSEVPYLYLDMCSVWVDHGSVSGREKKKLEHFVQPKNSFVFKGLIWSLCTVNMPHQCEVKISLYDGCYIKNIAPI